MRCPECSYDLTGCRGDSCPECGAGLCVVASTSLRFPTRLLYTGIGFVIVYCIAQTVWFWRETNMFNMLLASGGHPEPAQIAGDARVVLWARYVSNLCLGIGLTCIALSLFQVFRRMALLLASAEKAT